MLVQDRDLVIDAGALRCPQARATPAELAIRVRVGVAKRESNAIVLRERRDTGGVGAGNEQVYPPHRRHQGEDAGLRTRAVMIRMTSSHRTARGIEAGALRRDTAPGSCPTTSDCGRNDRSAMLLTGMPFSALN